jgi:hypothetical protein
MRGNSYNQNISCSPKYLWKSWNSPKTPSSSLWTDATPVLPTLFVESWSLRCLLWRLILSQSSKTLPSFMTNSSVSVLDLSLSSATQSTTSSTLGPAAAPKRLLKIARFARLTSFLRLKSPATRCWRSPLSIYVLFSSKSRVKSKMSDPFYLCPFTQKSTKARR